VGLCDLKGSFCPMREFSDCACLSFRSHLHHISFDNITNFKSLGCLALIPAFLVSPLAFFNKDLNDGNCESGIAGNISEVFE